MRLNLHYSVLRQVQLGRNWCRNSVMLSSSIMYSLIVNPWLVFGDTAGCKS